MAIPKRTRYEVLRRDNHSCRYCGAKAPHAELHVDHVIPKSRGGVDKPWNLTAACVDCNLSKGDGVPTEATIREVRQDESTYQASKGLPIFPCVYCAKPLQHAPGEDKPYDCETCNTIACSGYDAGLKRGLESQCLGSK